MSMMMRLVPVAPVLLCLAIAAAAEANEPVTLSGDVVCAKCMLHVEGLKECQNVLLVTEGPRETRYWLVDNDVNETFGDVCTAKKPVSVTGTVEQKDGTQWLTPAAIVPRGGNASRPTERPSP
jgi:hypothetical protein